MGLGVYVLCGIGFVIGVGWLLYVAPTPGPLSTTNLMVAMIPAISIVLGVVLMLAILWALAWLARVGMRLLRRLR